MIGMFWFVMVMVLGILALVAGLRFLGERGRQRVEPGVPPERFDRIESALSALEARLDDLQDQQRFLERLLAERPERPGLPRSRGGEEPASGEDGTDSILFDLRPDDEEER